MNTGYYSSNVHEIIQYTGSPKHSSHTRVPPHRNKYGYWGDFGGGGTLWWKGLGRTRTAHDSEQTTTLSDCFSISNPFLLKVGSGNETKDTHSLLYWWFNETIPWTTALEEPLATCTTEGGCPDNTAPLHPTPPPFQTSTPPAITLWFKHDWPLGCTPYMLKQLYTI